MAPDPNPPGGAVESPYIGVAPSRLTKVGAIFDIPVPQDGREYRWRNGFLEVKINGKWRVQEGKKKGQPFRVQELYKEGDEQAVAKLSHDQVAALQRKMDQAGLLSSYRVGIADAETLEAYRQLLGIANINGQVADRMLDKLVTNAEEGGQVGMEDSEDERGPLQIETTNPSDLAATSRTVGQVEIGRDPSAADQARFAAEYQGQERATQTDAYSRGLEAGEFTGPPTSEVAAQDFLRRERGGEVLATDWARGAEAFEELLLESYRLSRG